ncbi:MAG TPA: MBL fold metallo-hydrolase [Flavisolibacter sp.]|jgi:L-ascorbate metabolism protein UlaG (beta-lactamase superfamily)|nr:MBL fold metallo-hydrolase [Flavisolibacter sp.]
MLTVFVIILAILVAVYVFVQQAQFGRKPSGDELKRLEASPNYKNGQFQNLSDTPPLTGNASMLKVMSEFFFNKDKRNVPAHVLPSNKTNLFQLNPHEDVLVWFGHSSYFMQLDGKKFLVDPVFSGHASPVWFTTRSFKGSDVYTAGDIPEIDFLVLTHDHYDHLDYRTIVQLKMKVNKVITGLGVGAHLIRWGYKTENIFELGWTEEITFDNFTINATPARHFSGRTFKRNTSLWLSLVLATPDKRIFIGGDSGYDTHFKKIGEQFGPFDLVILENGQYNQYWKFIHMMPDETVQAALDLKAKNLLPVHWGKFSLSLHAWNEPITRLVSEARIKGLNVLHPMIGEIVYLDTENAFSQWWNLNKDSFES